MKLRYTPEALAELDAILDYIAAHSPHGARRVQQRLRNMAKLLVSHPLAGPMTEVTGVRRLLATPYPYVLYYQLSLEEIVIVAVRHTARDSVSSPER